ncbi:MAG: methyltransferase domain-containing protein [Chitinivibrionales bacterium]
MEIIFSGESRLKVSYFTTTMATLFPSSKCISSAFSKGARTYDQNAGIQRSILKKIAAKLPRKNLHGPWIDLGSGTGLLETMLNGPQIKIPMLCVDLAQEPLKMLAKQNNRPNIWRVQADIDTLPFKPGIFSLAVLSSVIQWLPDPAQSLSRAGALLSKEGRLLFSYFCKGTFAELFALRTEKGLPLPVALLGGNSIRGLVEKSGLKIIELEMFAQKSYFTSAWDILKNISAIGASAIAGPRLSKRQLILLCEEYEHRFKTKRGVPVSYTVALGQAKKGPSHGT